MSDPKNNAEVQQETVRRPPDDEKPLGPLPHGLEVLLKKAAVDAGFRKHLLIDSDAAAKSIGLTLDPVESAMLRAMPKQQVEAIIDHIEVPNAQRRAFLGQTAALMIAVMTGTVSTTEKQAAAQIGTPVSKTADSKNAGRVIQWNPDEQKTLRPDAPRKPMTITLDENGEIPLAIRLQAMVAREMAVPYDELSPQTPIPYGKRASTRGSQSIADQLRFNLGGQFDVKIPMDTLKSLDTIADLTKFVVASLVGYEEDEPEPAVAEDKPPELPWNHRTYNMMGCGGIRPEYFERPPPITHGDLNWWQPEVRKPSLDDVSQLVNAARRRSSDLHWIKHQRARKSARIVLMEERYPFFRQAIARNYGVRMPMETLRSFETARQLHRYLAAAWEGFSDPSEKPPESLDDFGTR